MKYSPGHNTYTVWLEKKKNRWWWLLLLLPLLLFIRCSHDITVTAVDAGNGMAIESLPVQAGYTSHFLYKDKQFFANIPVNRCDTTDSLGQAHFRDMPCSVYSYIFYCLSKIEFRAESECHGPDTTRCNFHYTWNETLTMRPALADLNIVVTDLDTDEPLAGAKVRIAYNRDGTAVVDTATTNPDGVAVIPDFRHCAVVDSLCGSCYGYADSSMVEVPASELEHPDDSRKLSLRPLKESFTFFVKDVETREPIPGAKAEVTVTSAGAVLRGSSVTNVDGKGRGEFREAFILAKVDIHASKVHYNDSVLVGHYTVEDFIKQPDDNRTVWLRPEPYVENFRNVDSITGAPIVGVTNVITVTDPAGNTETYTEVSNRNGYFPVKAKAGSKISIASGKKPVYRDKSTVVPSFDKGEIIRMSPEPYSVQFRTVIEESWDILPDCTLDIQASISRKHLPDNSGSGVFTVENLRYDETISIVASKTGYTNNALKIYNTPVEKLLKAPQRDRDIPLGIDAKPCDAGRGLTHDSGAAPVNSSERYNLGMKSGRFLLEIDAYSIPDYFIVYDGPDTTYPVIFNETVKDKRAVWLNFHNYVVTIVCKTSGPGSGWTYTANCP